MVVRADTVGHQGWRRWLVEPRRPQAIRERPKAYWWAVAAVCIGALMGQLDASIVTLALPSLQRDLHVSLGAVTWVGLSYLLVVVATVTAVGRFADMFGRKLLYTYGFLVFVVGSVLCGLAPDLVALTGFRVLQGLGAAMLQANSVAIIAVAVPSRALGRAIGIQGAAQAIGLAAGPTVGGLLLAVGGWRWIFFVNVPIGMIGLVAGWLFIPRSRNLQSRVRFDWFGLAMFAPAVVALLCAVSLGNSRGWGSPFIVGCIVGTVALAAGFIGYERRARHPLLDPSLFRRPGFSAGISSGLLSYLVLFGVLFVVPFYFERALALNPLRAGLELMVMPLALGVVAPIAGRLADRVGARPMTAGGMALVAVALLLLASFHGGAVQVIALLAVAGAGLGMFTPSNNAAIMGCVPKEQSGVASGMLNMTRGTGTAMGLAFTELVFGLSGGDAGGVGGVHEGFTVAALFLAGVAVLAALLAATGGNRPLDQGPALPVD